jgi:hypothetical protein
VDRVVTAAVLDEEVKALSTLAALSGWEIELAAGSSCVRVRFIHAKTGEAYGLVGDCAGYKAVPGAWTFVDPKTGAGGFDAFPAPPRSTPGGEATIFIDHGGPRICLPANRLAYGTNGGPHNDWQIANWIKTSRHKTIAEFVDRVHTELQASAGRWSSNR